jgi:hypothetical protein
VARRSALAFVLAALVSAPAAGDCKAQLSDATDACPCLFCPVFFVPAVCCADLWDDKSSRDTCVGLATGDCLCFRLIGIDESVLKTPELPPPPPPPPAPTGAVAF